MREGEVFTSGLRFFVGLKSLLSTNSEILIVEMFSVRFTNVKISYKCTSLSIKKLAKSVPFVSFNCI